MKSKKYKINFIKLGALIYLLCGFISVRYYLSANNMPKKTNTELLNETGLNFSSIQYNIIERHDESNQSWEEQYFIKIELAKEYKNQIISEIEKLNHIEKKTLLSCFPTWWKPTQNSKHYMYHSYCFPEKRLIVVFLDENTDKLIMYMIILSENN